MSEDREYLTNAVARIKAGKILAGSHMAGVFSKVAKIVEGAARVYLVSALATEHIQYDLQVRPIIRGEPPLEKLTLGGILVALENAYALVVGSGRFTASGVFL